MKTTNRLAPSTNGHTEAAPPAASSPGLGRRDRQMIEELGRVVWAATFAAVDAEPDLTAADAGKVAAAAEATAKAELARLLA